MEWGVAVVSPRFQHCWSSSSKGPICGTKVSEGPVKEAVSRLAIKEMKGGSEHRLKDHARAASGNLKI